MFFDHGVVLLSEAECHALLASQTEGHLSLTIGALPVVAPVRYQYLGGDVIIGAHDGPVRRAIARGNVVALGVDNATIDGPPGNVLVIGPANEITDPGERAQFLALDLSVPTGIPHPYHLRLRPVFISGHRTAMQ
jgi:nitroimidazol reductase NimA-like FMN-containing flavoprotein (pyridoxamine 5'-phosphate oxidase superfamily)